MSGRQSSAVAAAVRMVQRGHSVTEAAAKHGCNVRSVRRALRLAEIPTRLHGVDRRADVIAHAVFDRTLLRAGETVSMKHFVRDEVPAGLALLFAGGYAVYRWRKSRAEARSN